jgi:hypothetical protein
MHRSALHLKKIKPKMHHLRFSSFLILLTLCLVQIVAAQQLSLKLRSPKALTGIQFASSISDSTLSLQAREEMIYAEIKRGNVPNFLRKFKEIKDSISIDGVITTISYQVLPDYFAIGSDDDFFYVSMTPNLAQRIADLMKCSLPTKKMVDIIYQRATIKLKPQPIPPTKAMTTLPIFIAHTDSVKSQLHLFKRQHLEGALTAGNKKDIIISNKIYTEKTAKVVIYGWHKPDGKAIQPVYNKHTNLWTDYSHGARYIRSKVWLNGKKTTMAKILNDPKLCVLLSDEGTIEKPYYPKQ